MPCTLNTEKMTTLKIKGFELLEELGEGGMGTVYRARQLSLDRLVAIKVLPRNVSKDKDHIERFLIEAKIAASLKHNNLVQVYEAGQVDDQYYFVMELVSGYNVASWLERKGRLTEEDALLIAGYVADALSYAWEKAEIIHGDIKPANILVDSDGEIKLADFLAFTPPDGSGPPQSLKDNISGTPNYISPEQARGNDSLDCRTDIYALGAVLYHIVTGKLPFDEDEYPQEIMRKQMVDFIRDPCSLNPELSKPCGCLIEKMMVKDATERYLNWEDVKRDIQRVKKGEMPLVTPPEQGASTVRHTAKRTPSSTPENSSDQPPVPKNNIIYTLFGLFIFGAAVFLFFRQPPEDTVLSKTVEEEQVQVEKMTTSPPPPPPEIAPPRRVPSRITTQAPRPVDRKVDPVPLIEQTPLPDAPESLAENSMQNPEALLEYADFFERLIPFVRRRNYPGAREMLVDWIETHPEHPFADRARTDRDRMDRLQDFYKLLENQQAQIIGTTVHASPGISGTLVSIENGFMFLSHEVADAGNATISLPLTKLHDADFLQLIVAASPEQAQENAAIWRMAKAQFDQAYSHIDNIEHPDTVNQLSLWCDQWQTSLENARALDAVLSIQKSIDSQDYPEAQTRLDEASEQFADTDVFVWARQEQIDQIRQQLDDAQRPLPAEEFVEESPAKDPAATKINEKVEQFDIIEIKENYIYLDGQVIRLRFRFRGDIRQVNKQEYSVTLGSESGTIQTLFPAEAFKWVKKIPRWGQVRQRKNVYAIVEAKHNRIRLIGRKKARQTGNQPVKYIW